MRGERVVGCTHPTPTRSVSSRSVLSSERPRTIPPRSQDTSATSSVELTRHLRRHRPVVPDAFVQPQFARARADSRGVLGGEHDRTTPQRACRSARSPRQAARPAVCARRRCPARGRCRRRRRGCGGTRTRPNTHTKCPTSQSGGGPLCSPSYQVVEQLIEAARAPHRWWSGEIGDQRGRALEPGDELEQAIQRPRRPWASVGDRRERALCQLLDRADHAGCRGARHRGVVYERQRQPVVASARFAVRKVAGVLSRRDHAPRRQRHRVLVERLARGQLDAGCVQRQCPAEGSAQVIALWQLAGVERQQRPRPGEECHLQWWGRGHSSKYTAAFAAIIARCAYLRIATGL